MSFEVLEYIIHTHMRELSGAPTTHLYIVSHSFLCVKDLILCMYSDYINHFNPSIITCLLPGRNPAPEQIHITSLPPSIPTDQEPEQAEGQGEDVYPVHSVFFKDSSHFYEIHETFQPDSLSDMERYRKPLQRRDNKTQICSVSGEVKQQLLFSPKSRTNC